MGPKVVKKTENVVVVESIKAKRGRKSKKELMASLNMEMIVKDKDVNKNDTISLNINEINVENVETNNIYETVINDNNELTTNMSENNVVIISNPETPDEPDENPDEKPPVKKRGRKPKGGKIIQQVVSTDPQKEDKPNIILHLKCSMKDLQNTTQNNGFVESYNSLGCKNDLTYEVIGNENSSTFNDNTTTTISNLENEYDVEIDDELICKDVNKEIWKKLKHLEHNLHINNVNNKRSACFWDTCEFDNPPVYIPKHFINGTYHVYGCFCSPECGVAYLMNENLDSSTKFERYHLLNHIYTKIYDYKKNIKPSPNPYYMLEKYYGNLTIQEYRSLLRNERLFLIVDKPLTRILPELHEDNDDFILNNKVIPSNTYQVKARLQRKKQNKTSILNEKFGITNQAVLE